MYRGGLDIVGKEHFTSLYFPARETAITKRNILAAWAATGLFPFNPERVLRHTPKPPDEPTLPEANEASCPQTLERPATPVTVAPITPVTPVTTEALTALHNLIKQELNNPSKRHVRRHVQKLASAAKILFAKQTLLQD